jgi:hypothetical protein
MTSFHQPSDGTGSLSENKTAPVQRSHIKVDEASLTAHFCHEGVWAGGKHPRLISLNIIWRWLYTLVLLLLGWEASSDPEQVILWERKCVCWESNTGRLVRLCGRFVNFEWQRDDGA